MKILCYTQINDLVDGKYHVDKPLTLYNESLEKPDQ